jgi:2-polyprenyl-3-methyl-5-hydroxy-6-metoxy-1,4-benzoquinol methylase
MSNEVQNSLLVDDYNSKKFKVYYEDERHEMIKYIPDEASLILDVGCASGKFGQIIKQNRSIEVWGVEPNQEAASVARQRIDRVINSTFNESLNLSENSFDCIIFNDVLEHFVDPYSALVYCKKILKKQGSIISSIPNVRYFDNLWKLIVEKEWKYEEWGILDKTHLRFFTERSILRTFDELGYQVDLIEGINPIEKESPHHLRKFNFLNFIARGNLDDMRYLQFAVVAHPH